MARPITAVSVLVFATAARCAYVKAAASSSASDDDDDDTLPRWAVGAWNRTDSVRGSSHDTTSTKVHWVQSSFLFSDCRVPADRKDAEWVNDRIAARDPAALAELARQSGFAGATTFVATERGDRPRGERGAWPGDLTWHHVIADYQDICMDPATEWPALVNGTQHSGDVSAAQLFYDLKAAAAAAKNASTFSRSFREHGLPVDQPSQQYEEWHDLASRGTSPVAFITLAAVWPPATTTTTNHAATTTKNGLNGTLNGTAALVAIFSSGQFAFARDKGPLPAPFACSLSALVDAVESGSMDFDDALPYFLTELSYGASFPVVDQSTVPDREHLPLQAIPAMCAALGDAVILDGTRGELQSALGCGAP